MGRRLPYAALLFATVLLGLAVRFARVGLPPAVTKYGGSALWAIAIFWLLSLFLLHRTAATRAIAALLVSSAVECFKLVRTPLLDRFRFTLPGKLLLGRVFSFRDLLAYALGIALAGLIDVLLTQRSRAQYGSVPADFPGLPAPGSIAAFTAAAGDRPRSPVGAAGYATLNSLPAELWLRFLHRLGCTIGDTPPGDRSPDAQAPAYLVVRLSRFLRRLRRRPNGEPNACRLPRRSASLATHGP